MSPSPTTPRQPPRLPSADVHASPPRRSSPARDSASAVVRTAVPSPVSRFEDTVRRGCKTSLQAYNKISNEYSKAHNDANIDDILSLDVLTLLRALQAEVAQPQSEAAKLKARLARRWKTSVAEIDATFSATTSQHFLKHVCAIAQLIDLRTALPLLQQERDQRQSGSASHRGLKRTRDWTPQDADRVLKRLREEKDTAVDDGDENSEREIEGVRRAQDPLPDDLDELSDDDFFAPESLSPSPSPSPSASPYIFAPPESKLLQNHARKRRHLSPITEEPTPLPTRSPHSSQFLQSPLSFENHHSTAEPPLATPGLTQSSQDSDIPDNKSPPIPVASAPPDRPMASAVEEDGSVHAVDADGPAVLSDDEVPTLDIDRPAVLSDDDRAHALASLRPKTKLNSVAVNHALEFVVASQQEWAWIDSMHPAGLSDELAREQNATSFVHAVHLAPSHWALAVVNSLTKDLFILNSYRSLSQAVIQQVEATVADKLDVSERLCPQQPNDYDCGVYTVAFAFYAVAARPLPGTIASRFWRRCLEVLVSGNAPAEDDGDYGTVSIPTLTIGDSGSFYPRVFTNVNGLLTAHSAWNDHVQTTIRKYTAELDIAICNTNTLLTNAKDLDVILTYLDRKCISIDEIVREIDGISASLDAITTLNSSSNFSDRHNRLNGELIIEKNHLITTRRRWNRKLTRARDFKNKIGPLRSWVAHVKERERRKLMELKASRTQAAAA